MKKILALVMVMTMLFAIASVANADPVDTVSIAYNKAVDTFTPIAEVPEQATTSMIFEPLWRQDAMNHVYLPAIAKSWEWVDPMTLHVVLNDDVYDTAGNHITASDVVYSIGLKIDPGNNTTFIDIDNASYTDYDLTLPVLAPAHTAIELTISNIYIVSQAAWEASEDEMALTPVGSGPYKLTEYVANSHCTLTFNEDWHGKTEEPQIKTVKVRFVTDAAQRLNVLRTGDVDYAYGLNFTDKVIVEAEPSLQTIILPEDGQLGIYFNMQSPLFKDNLAFRQAICYAINNAAVSMVNKAGLAPVARGIGVQSGAMHSNAAFAEGLEKIIGDTNYYEYNIEKAKELLKEANVPAGTTINFLYYTTAGMDTLAKVLQGTLQEIGLNLNLDLQASQPAYIGKLFSPDGYDITPLSLEAEPLAQWFMISNNLWDMNKFDEETAAEIGDLVNAAYASSGDDEVNYLLELERIYYENCYAYQIYDDYGFSACKTNVKPVMNTVLHPDYTKWVVE